jgi:hypothetical protein
MIAGAVGAVNKREVEEAKGESRTEADRSDTADESDGDGEGGAVPTAQEPGPSRRHQEVTRLNGGATSKRRLSFGVKVVVHHHRAVLGTSPRVSPDCLLLLQRPLSAAVRGGRGVRPPRVGDAGIDLTPVLRTSPLQVWRGESRPRSPTPRSDTPERGRRSKSRESKAEEAGMIAADRYSDRKSACVGRRCGRQAVARKMAKVAWALVRTGAQYDPGRVYSQPRP